MIRVVHPGSGPWFFLPTPDPRSRGQKRHRIPDPDPQHYVEETQKKKNTILLCTTNLSRVQWLPPPWRCPSQSTASHGTVQSVGLSPPAIVTCMIAGGCRSGIDYESYGPAWKVRQIKSWSVHNMTASRLFLAFLSFPHKINTGKYFKRTVHRDGSDWK